jgi:hypothetical protein
MTMNKAWLRCEVEQGMFSSEVVVKVKTANGESAAYFVPRETVSGNRVEVQVEKLDNRRLAILPTDHPYAAIPVSEEDLTYP